METESVCENELLNLVEFPVDSKTNSTDDKEIILPKHLRCSSHTLSLIATTDFNNYLKGSRMSKIHHTTLGKCTTLWNSSRRPKSSEIIVACLNASLRYPTAVRWNSMYDGISDIIRHKSNLNVVIEKLGLTCFFNDKELQYLQELCEVLKPIATALDLLQATNCYYGLLLPVLFSLRARLEKKIQENLMFTKEMVGQLKQSLESRFEQFFQFSDVNKEAIVATTLHPNFKFRWLPENVDKATEERIFQMCFKGVQVCAKDSSKETEISISNDFYLLRKNKDSCRSLEEELRAYFNDDNESLKGLIYYPNARKAFLRYNTHLCSSAPVERLFSLAGFILCPTRGCMSDEAFEAATVLKGNPN